MALIYKAFLISKPGQIFGQLRSQLTGELAFDPQELFGRASMSSIGFIKQTKLLAFKIPSSADWVPV